MSAPTEETPLNADSPRSEASSDAEPGVQRRHLTANEAIEQLGLGWFQIYIVLVGGIGSVAAGATLTAVGYMLIDLAEHFKLSPVETAALPSATSFAQTTGALLWGLLADKMGRRPIFTVNLSLSAFALLAASVAPNWPTFVTFMTLTMLGLGGFTTLDMAIVVEFMPNAWRALAVMILTSSWPIGEIYASLLQLWCLPYYGWRGLIVALSIPPLLAVVLRSAMPESVRWLVSQNRLEEASAVIAKVGRWNGKDMSDVVIVLDGVDALAKKQSESQGNWYTRAVAQAKKVVAPSQQRNFLILAFITAVWQSTITSVFAFIPSMLSKVKKLPPESIVYVMLLNSVVQWPADVISYWVGTKIPHVQSFAWISVGCTITLATFIFVPGPIASSCCILLFTFVNEGSWYFLQLMTQEAFPTSIRTTASGMIQMVAGVMASIAPIYTSAYLESTPWLPMCSFSVLFWICACLIFGVTIQGELLNHRPESLARDTKRPSQTVFVSPRGVAMLQ